MLGIKLAKGLDERRVRRLLGLFFLALAIPALILIVQAYSQLKWEAFRQDQLLAEELASRIDSDLIAWVNAEEARSFADYTFLVIEGDPAANFVQRSPLSAYPVESALPGLLSYFQVDAEGELSTPLLPPDGVDPELYGISPEEQLQRVALEQTLRDVLAENRLVQGGDTDLARFRRAASSEEQPARALRSRDEAAPLIQAAPSFVEPVTELADDRDAQGQAAFDQLRANSLGGREQAGEAQERGDSLGRVEDLNLDAPYEQKLEELKQSVSSAVGAASTGLDERQKRTEQSSLPEPELLRAETRPVDLAQGGDFRVSTFESEIDPFEFGMLGTGHLVMFRNVWREGQRHIQGAVFEQQPFIVGAIESTYRNTSLARTSDLIIAYQGSVLSALDGQAIDSYLTRSQELAGSLLHQARLSPPLGELELIFGVNQLPRGPGTLLLGWVTVVLATVLCAGFYLMYRFAIGQIRLARQQQDFVSAVSHELKTPLTSIRMYGEMLKAGWADEEKKQTYYDYIYGESERLSRLIENVLQLARMNRNDPQFDLKRVSVAELMSTVESKIASQVERAGFSLEFHGDGGERETELLVDPDCFTQIIINLVDNAIKFSVNAEDKAIEISDRVMSDRTVLFTVRDFGPGIQKEQMKKIFGLFYRPESELTRETVGTGIGLALVHQLTTAMAGQVDVRNRDPGAEFRVSFPIAD